MDFIKELGLLFIFASIFGLIGKLFRLPLIFSYILAGIFIGKNGFGIIIDPEQIKSLSTIGIVFLLFLVGIELNVKKIKELGKTAVYTAFFQMAIAIFGGFVVARLLGFDSINAFYIALALSFNSTVIVVKSLSERKELNSLHGRIAVGVLLLQDAVAITVLIVLNGLGRDGIVSLDQLSRVIAGGALLFVGAILAGQYVFPSIFRQFAKQNELLMISAIGFALLAALIASWFGLSIEAGAFIAGVSLATLPYSTEIIAKLQSLRDFFLTIFFVALGLSVNLTVANHWSNIAIFSVILVIINPLILSSILTASGFKARTSFLTGVSFSQMGEFSLIIIALAYNLGHITNSTFSIVAVVSIISIAVSSILMAHSHLLSHFVHPLLRGLQKSDNGLSDISLSNQSFENHVIVFGAHRIGQRILKSLKKHRRLKKNIVLVDLNPAIIKQFEQDNVTAIYGDMVDPEILDLLNLPKSQLIISTIPEFQANLFLLKKLKKMRSSKIVSLVTAYTPEDAIDLYRLGANYVILPQYLSGDYVSDLIEKFSPDQTLAGSRRKHIKELENYLIKDAQIQI